MDLAQTFDNIFLAASNPFAETISYSADGVVTAIKGIVKRGGFITSKQKADNTKSLYDYEVVVSVNDVVKVTVNKDTVTMNAPHYGENNTYIVGGIIGKTPMAWHLGLKG